MSKDDWHLCSVKVKGSTISDLCKGNNLTYTSGCGYYQLGKKDENVSVGKKLVAVDKTTGDVIWGSTGAEVRAKLGIDTAETSLSAADAPPNISLYVNSTSANRGLAARTAVMIHCPGAKKGASAKCGPPKKRPVLAAEKNKKETHTRDDLQESEQAPSKKKKQEEQQLSHQPTTFLNVDVLSVVASFFIGREAMTMLKRDYWGSRLPSVEPTAEHLLLFSAVSSFWIEAAASCEELWQPRFLYTAYRAEMFRSGSMLFSKLFASRLRINPDQHLFFYCGGPDTLKTFVQACPSVIRHLTLHTLHTSEFSVDTITRRDLLPLGKFANLESLHLFRSTAGDKADDAIGHLISKLKNLRVLAVQDGSDGSVFDGSFIERLGAPKKLERFEMRTNSELSVLTLDGLAKCTNLTHLDVAGHLRLCDDDLTAVSGLTKLESLNLEQCSVTDKGLKHLSRLRNLKYLNVGGDMFAPKTTAKGWKHVPLYGKGLQLVLPDPNRDEDEDEDE